MPGAPAFAYLTFVNHSLLLLYPLYTKEKNEENIYNNAGHIVHLPG
jgi:hypothetical protein